MRGEAIVSHIVVPLNRIRVCGGWLFFNPGRQVRDDGDWGEMGFLLEEVVRLPLSQNHKGGPGDKQDVPDQYPFPFGAGDDVAEGHGSP